LKIAILGTRGIPANYGGFETFAEECGARLAAKGHEVTAYGRSHYVDRSIRRYRGVRIVVFPSLRFKYLDTIFHTFLSVVHAFFKGYDAILICNAANSVFAWIPRLRGAAVVVNVDGIERLRLKWNRLGKKWYHCSEYFSTRFPNAIVTDAKVIEQYYLVKYGSRSTFIPYGAVTEKPAGRKQLDLLALSPGNYFLYVSRLEPENNAHLVVKAFEKVRTGRKLIVVGDAPYAREYIESVKSTSDPRIVFTGAIYGDGYKELMANAFCYIHATEVGGTHPALLEAMGQANVIIANGTPENIETLGGAGILYARNDPEDLARKMQEVEDEPEACSHFGKLALERAEREYCWDDIVSSYERLFERVIKTGK
jgi:glycosyltransferase involved in cell wall biosynthesis